MKKEIIVKTLYIVAYYNVATNYNVKENIYTVVAYNRNVFPAGNYLFKFSYRNT